VPPATPFKVGPYEFAYVSYDAFGDVGYVRRFEGHGGIGVEDTPEGHAFLTPVNGGDEIVGIDFGSPRAQLERTGNVSITLPSGEVVDVPELERLIRA
jgi:hypothetical protein